MNQDFIFSRPEFTGLSDEKKAFIQTILMHEKFSNPSEAMKVFMEQMAEAKARNIQFTNSESSILISVLQASLDDDGKKKAEKILKMTGFHK